MRVRRAVKLGVGALAIAGALVAAVTGPPAVAQAAYLGYPDLNPGAWYVDDGTVAWSEENHVINGEGDGRWNPNGRMDRGQAATILFNYSGDEAPDAEATFSDVDTFAWAASGIAWAQDHGVFSGYVHPDGTVTMDPWTPLSREQAATILYNMFGHDRAASTSSLGSFSDANEISDWALNSVAWAVENGVMGNSDGLAPKSGCTRAEFVAMLKNVAQIDEANPGDGADENFRTITRGEWIALLLRETEAICAPDADSPYQDIAGHQHENAIKSAYVYDILPDSGDIFGPDKIATRDFVYSVAILAADVDTAGLELAARDASEVIHPELIAGAIQEGLASLDDDGNFRPLEAFNPSESDALISKIVAIGAADDAEGGGQGAAVEYRGDVTVINGYELDGSEYSFYSDSDVSVGDKIALVPEDEMAGGASGTVTDVHNTGDETTVTIDQATSPEEIFRSIDVAAQNLAINPSELDLADGVEFDSAADKKVSTLAQIGLPELKLKVKYPPRGNGGNFSAAVSVSTSPYINVEVKYDGLFGGLKRLDVGIGSESTIEGNVSAKVKDDVTIDLSNRPAKIPVTTGISVDVNLALEISAESEVSISASVDNSLGYRYIKGGENGPYGKTDAESAFELDANARAGLSPYAVINAYGLQLADLALSAGIEADGNLIVRDTGMVCNNVAMFAYADISVGEHSDLMKWLDLTLRQKLWTKSNSPYKENIHWENGKYVPKCTYKEETGKPGDPDTPPTVDTGVFEQLAADEKFFYGAGTTTVSLNINADGTFTGSHNWSDAPWAAGTVSWEEGNFSGKFSSPQKVSEHGYAVVVEKMVVEDLGKTYVNEYGFSVTVTAPRDLYNGRTFTIYLPGATSDELPLDYNTSTLPWADSIFDSETGKLLCNYFFSPSTTGDSENAGKGVGFYPSRLMS